LRQHDVVADGVEETWAIRAFAAGIIVALCQRLLLRFKLAGGAGDNEQPSPRMIAAAFGPVVNR